MDCFKPIVKNDDDCNASGGVYVAFAIPADSITDLAFNASGYFTGFTLIGTPEITKFDSFEDDDSAFYNQEQPDADSAIWNQEGYLKWNKITAEKVDAARSAAGCCKGSVWVWFLNDGSVHLQGVDYFKSTNRWKYTKKRAKIAANIMSNTGADKSIVDYRISSVSSSLIPVDKTIITEDYMDSLSL